MHANLFWVCLRVWDGREDGGDERFGRSDVATSPTVIGSVQRKGQTLIASGICASALAERDAIAT